MKIMAPFVCPDVEKMDFDLAYANSDFIPGAADLPRLWAESSADLRRNLSDRARLGLRYGPGARQSFDLLLPLGKPRGTLVFVHGGYWLETDPALWSFVAAGGLARGWAVALPGYTLAPEARISAMTREIGQALSAIAAMTEGEIVLTGHSAGGHLAARMACEGAPLAPEVAARITRIVPISPLSDLEPISLTAMNRDLRLDAAEIATESPARLPRRQGAQVTVWVGGQERPAFLWQARLLSEAWDCPWHVAPGRNHFSVLEDLCDPASGLIGLLTEGRPLGSAPLSIG